MTATLGLTLVGALALAAASGEPAPRRQPTATPAVFASAAPVDRAPVPDPVPRPPRRTPARTADGADHGIRLPHAGPDVSDAQVRRPARPTADPQAEPATDPEPNPVPTEESEPRPAQGSAPQPQPAQPPPPGQQTGSQTPPPPSQSPDPELEPASDPEPERASDPDAGAVGFELLQATRAAAGVPPLIRHAHADAVAQAWAEQLAESGRLRHNPSFDTELAAGLAGSSYAENVGQAASGDPTAVHAAFEASPAHLANITGDFTHVGVGAAVSADGTLWVVHDLVAVD